MTIRWNVWRYVDEHSKPRLLGYVDAATAHGALQAGRVRLEVLPKDDGHIFVTPVLPWAERWS